MKGYKGMNGDMKCRGYQFEVGKKYRIAGEVELCKNGFHFCEKLFDVFEYYEKDEPHRYFEIEASGTIKSDGEKSVAEEITIIRELEEAEINRAFYGNGYGYGYGYGYGNGYGYGYGNVYGDGDGYGYGDGNGYGDGDGYGYGDGDGDGYGYGDGKNIQKILIFN